MALYEALYGRCRNSQIGCLEPDEARLLGTNLVRYDLEKEKEYADRQAHDVAFIEGEKILLSVSSLKGVIRFGKKGKLSPRYIASFEKYHEDKSHILDFSTVQLDQNLDYEEEPMTILDRQVWKLGSKEIASLKVQWRGQPVEVETWETEHDMQR
uniref:Uncharacterized protein LOC104231543 n=1 Tax=Nicotiana sylvestris TaxID=4096 RepID=A0A1U7WW78_NICSY